MPVENPGVKGVPCGDPPGRDPYGVPGSNSIEYPDTQVIDHVMIARICAVITFVISFIISIEFG